jgi:hypothetical protein
LAISLQVDFFKKAVPWPNQEENAPARAVAFLSARQLLGDLWGRNGLFCRGSAIIDGPDFENPYTTLSSVILAASHRLREKLKRPEALVEFIGAALCLLVKASHGRNLRTQTSKAGPIEATPSGPAVSSLKQTLRIKVIGPENALIFQ